MGESQGVAHLKLVEIEALHDIWVDGIAKVESLGGGTFRFILYRRRHPIDGEGPDYFEIVALLMTNLAAIGEAMPLLRTLGTGTAIESIASAVSALH